MYAKEIGRLKIAAGIGICAYEAAALAVADSDALPPITAILRRHPLLSLLAVAWVSQHLLVGLTWDNSFKWDRPERQLRTAPDPIA